ncbi:MAG: NUDIX hydrolase [Thermoplasmata archaeon]|nr:NUDIX hydrolase [Thermoplasmata archaeon]
MHKNPALTVDAIAIKDGQIILIKRKNPPFQGSYALPGGFVDYGETVENAVIREFKEETGLNAEIKDFIGIYSEPDRDPRGHTVSAVFELMISGGTMLAGDDAAEVSLFSLDELPDLAFDHGKIIADYILFLAIR